MTEKEEEIGKALRDLVANTVNGAPHVDGGRNTLAGLRCEVFADADGNVWARDPDTQELVGRIQLVVSPCPA